MLQDSTDTFNGTKSGLDVKAGQWHHIAGVFYGSKRCIYVDGVLRNIGFFSDIIYDTNHIPEVGAWKRNFSRFFSGEIDEVRVWNKALTGSEIRDSMKKDLSDLTNVIGYWKFDEGSGSTATDETGNNDGTINGATYSTDTPD